MQYSSWPRWHIFTYYKYSAKRYHPFKPIRLLLSFLKKDYRVQTKPICWSLIDATLFMISLTCIAKLFQIFLKKKTGFKASKLLLNFLKKRIHRSNQAVHISSFSKKQHISNEVVNISIYNWCNTFHDLADTYCQ